MPNDFWRCSFFATEFLCLRHTYGIMSASQFSGKEGTNGYEKNCICNRKRRQNERNP